MTAATNGAVVTRFFEAYGTRHDVEEAGALFADNATITDSNLPQPMDVPGYKGLGLSFLTAFDGMAATIIEQIAADDRVVTRVCWSGTHTGDFNGIPPAGKAFRAEGIIIDRLVAGKIVERHAVSDYVTMFPQLRVIPVMG
jgi:predicted ester cyclase